MPISYVPNPHAADDPSWVGAADRVALANFADREAFAERVALVSQRWAAATTALFGLTSLTGVISGTVTIDKVTATSRVLVGGGIGLALLLAVGSVLCLQTAAGGSLRAGPSATTELERLERARARAEQNLAFARWGRRLAVLAVLAVAVTVTLVWAATPHSEPVTKITATNGVTYCGTIRIDDRAATITSPDRNESVVPVNQIARITAAGDCHDPS